MAGKEKLPDDARDWMNKQWKTMLTLPEGEEKELRHDVLQRMGAKLARQYDVPIEGEGPLDTVAKYGLKAINYGAGLAQAPFLAMAEQLAGPQKTSTIIPKAETPNERATFDMPGGRPLPVMTDRASDVVANAVMPNRLNTTTGEVLQDVGVPEMGKLSDVVPGYAEPGTPGLWPPNKGGPLDPTGRGTLGFLADFFGSPGGARMLNSFGKDAEIGQTATALAQDEKEAKIARINGPTVADRVTSKLDFASDPMGYTAEHGGRKLYDGVFYDADAMATANRADPISDVGWRNNVWGSDKTIKRQFDRIAERKASDVRNNIAKAYNADPEAMVPRADIEGMARQDMSERMGVGGQSQAARKATRTLDDLMTDAYGEYRPNVFPDPTLEKEFQDLARKKIGKDYSGPSDPRIASHKDQLMADYYGKNAFDINELHDLKESMQEIAEGQGSYQRNPTAPRSPTQSGLRRVTAARVGDVAKDIGYTARRGVENLADEAEPGLGGQIYRDNSDIASVKSASKELADNARETWSDAIMHNLPAKLTGAMAGGTGAYLMGAHEYWPYAMGILGGAAATSTPARTAAGLLLGKYPGQAMSNTLRTTADQIYNPWFHQGSPYPSSESRGAQ